MQQIAQNFYNACTSLADYSQLIVMGVLIVVILIIGLSLIISKDARENAKKWIPWVLIGTAVALFPVVIAEAVANMAQF